MKRFGTVLLVGTAISCFIGGKIYAAQSGNRTIGEPEYGAFIAFIGFLISCVVASIASKTLIPKQYRLLWVVCCVLYPSAIYLGYSSTISMAQNAALVDPNTRALLIKNYELDTGKEPTPEELAEYQKAIMSQAGVASPAETQGVLRQFFWGPVFVSIYFYGFMITKKRKGQVPQPAE